MQVIEQKNVDEFIELSQMIFELRNIFGLASGLTTMRSLILPALWLGDLLGQNKLACLLSWACRRCLVRYRELGTLLLRADGSAEPTAPPPRLSRFHRLAYAVGDAGSNDFIEVLDATPNVRPALLNLGEGAAGIGAAGLPRGVFTAVADDFTHVASLGIVKMTEVTATKLIVDLWPTRPEGVLAVRLLELRVAEMESFSDGIVSRRGFPEGFLLETLLTAGERMDLLRLFVPGIGTDLLVIPDNSVRIEFLQMIDDLIYVCSMVTALRMSELTLVAMQKANFRYGWSCLPLSVCVTETIHGPGPSLPQLLHDVQAPLRRLLEVLVQQVPRLAAPRRHDPRVGHGLELLDGIS